MKALLCETIETLQAIEQGKPWQQLDNVTGRWIDAPGWACPINALLCGCQIRVKPKHIRQELALELLEAAREALRHMGSDYDEFKTSMNSLKYAIQNIDEDQ